MSVVKDKKYYITNCLLVVLNSDYSLSKYGERAADIAEAIRIAAEFGTEAAHEYLIQLGDAAAAGKYVEAGRKVSRP